MSVRRRDDRAAFDLALRPVRTSAYPPGEFVGQESFMLSSEILGLAVRAGVAPGVRVLDLCCGVAGPGRLISRKLGCAYTGVDASPSAIDIARERAGDLDCRFETCRIPPVPAGPFDVVLLLETLLAFPDKPPLMQGISAALDVGGRFAFTLEEGPPLTDAERAAMPDADTVWPIPLPDLHACLEQAGLRVRWQTECSRSHRAIADSLLHAFTHHSSHIAARVGRPALDDLLAAHRLWRDWLKEGRVRKFACVAEKGEPHPRGVGFGLGSTSITPPSTATPSNVARP